ncbi:MAG: FG-GAP repeat domain-containing protein, partial [bacterium]
LPVASVHADCLPEYTRELEPFPIYDAQGTAPHAWYGGWQSPRPQLLDIDADADLDLFVAEEDGQLRFYRNEGNVSSADFVLVTDDFAGVHELYFTRFADVDSDGDWDLLVEAPGFEVVDSLSTIEKTGAYLYTNVGGPVTPSYQNLSSHPDGYFVDALGEPIPFVTTAPDFVDLVGDGDQDLIFGEATGRLYLYRNQSGRGGSPFVLETTSYQDIVIVPGGCNPERPLRAIAPQELLHGFMLFSFHDIDDDSRPDMFVGDQFNSNVYFYGNAGGVPNPNFVCQTESFFPDTTGAPGIFPQFLVPAFGDLDGDQDPDAILGPGTTAAVDRMWLYVNTGSPGSAVLEMQSGAFLPEFDMGRESAVAFADLDEDADLDLFLGTGTSFSVTYFENVGSAEAAEFGLVDPEWISLLGASWIAPEFADLDADGDLDITVGVSSGAVRLWRNNGGSFVEVVDADFGDVFGRTFRSNLNGNAVPRFFDEDGDGDLDCLGGQFGTSGEARLPFFRNDGTAQAHDFVLATTDYQGLGVLGTNLAPALGDVDDDGDLDLLVGKGDGTIEFFRNRGAPGAPAFEPEVARLAGIDVGEDAVPVLADLDADGDLDLVLGESGGGLDFYRNPGEPPAAVALRSPAPDAAVPGRDPVRFAWDPVSGSGQGTITYDLLLSPSPGPPRLEWVIRSGLPNPEASLQVFFEGLRFIEDFWWAVVARDGCTAGPPSEWRHGVHVGFQDDHLEFVPEPAPGSAPEEGPREVPVGGASLEVHPSPTRG